MPAASSYTIHIQIGARYAGRARPSVLRRAAQAALCHQGVAGPVEVTIQVSGDVLLRRLNRQFLGHDEPTDVLSFPTGVESKSRELRVGKLHSHGKTSQHATRNTSRSTPSGASGQHATRNTPPYLGDIAISLPRARAQAAAAGHSVEAELRLLVVHGVLHLLGHDHARKADKAHMWAAQDEILAGLK